MRKMLILSVLLLGVSWAVAQNSPQSSPASSPASSGQTSSATSSAGHTTVEGCLSGSGGKYTLTDDQGKTYDLTGDTSKLAEHVGHEVKITGSAGAGSSPASGSAASGGSMGNSGGQSLEISSVKHVSKTCKNAGGMSK